GWHLHFISKDRKLGGHIFETEFDNARVRLDRISRIEIQLPADIEFDIYTLKSVSEEEIRQVEQASPGR
ncbi:MAG: acetolactate decarboxylase, partial [bacterium]